MNDDMRLKSMVVKGPKIKIQCQKACDKAKSCPCDALRNFLTDESPSDITSIEMEWMHIPTYKESVFWLKLVFPIVASILFVGLLLFKGCSHGHSAQELKVSLHDNGNSIECCVDSAASFEKQTNDILRIKTDVQALKLEAK